RGRGDIGAGLSQAIGAERVGGDVDDGHDIGALPPYEARSADRHSIGVILIAQDGTSSSNKKRRAAGGPSPVVLRPESLGAAGLIGCRRPLTHKRGALAAIRAPASPYEQWQQHRPPGPKCIQLLPECAERDEQRYVDQLFEQRQAPRRGSGRL